jgi:hypothetical protein
VDIPVSEELVAQLNGDCHASMVDRGALDHALRAQGEDLYQRVTEQCPHLFAAVPLFVSAAHMAQMRAVVEAVEQVVAMPAWHTVVQQRSPEMMRHAPRAKGVFFGYDFHLNADGAHLIEINTNAGGALLNALLLQSQSEVEMPGTVAADDDLQQAFLDMFRNEWRLERGDALLNTVAILDERPQEQYLYPEFVLVQQMFERAGITALIADPSELHAQSDGLYCQGRKVDLVYNRLTDFSLLQHPLLNEVYSNNQIVLTPHPLAYALYADKRNLELLTEADSLRAMGVADSTIAVLQAGIPQARVVRMDDSEHWWRERKQWFFKPASGFGSKGAYRGDKVTQRVFAEIMQGGYIAQRMASPGERMVCAEGAEPAVVKSDVRCYVYNEQVQLVAARLYQGQTTNFRTAGGGFAPVRIVG